MIIQFSPIVGEKKIDYKFRGEQIQYEDKLFDLSNVRQNSIYEVVYPIVDVYRGSNGELEVTLIQYHSPDAPEKERFPAPFRSGNDSLNQWETTIRLKELSSQEDAGGGGGSSIIENSDFKTMPYIVNRADGIYNFSIANRVLTISSRNYNQYSSNKDFAFVTNENILPNDKMTISFKAKTSLSNQSLTIRPAYGQGSTINLGESNVWNSVNQTITINDNQRQTNYLYFDLNGSYQLELKDFRVMIEKTVLVDSIKASKITNSTSTINRLLEVAWSYQNKIGQFNYGNSQTAYDVSTMRDGSNRYEMDCSSFVSLLLHGVPFEHSKYNGQSENKESKYFFNEIDSRKYRYANNMAKFAVENGLTFKPNNDFSNVQPGDVLFFAWNQSNKDEKKANFMGIEHIAIYLNTNHFNDHITLQYYPNSQNIIYRATESYMSDCVLVARFPFRDISQRNSLKNLVVNGDVSKANGSNLNTGSWTLSESLKKGQFYTVAFEGEILSSSEHYFMVYNKSHQVFSDFQRKYPQKNSSGLFVFHFYYTGNLTEKDISIKIGGTNTDKRIPNSKVDWIRLYEGIVIDDVFRHQLGYGEVSDIAILSNYKSIYDQGYAPNSQYLVEGNKLFLNINFAIKNGVQGAQTIGSIPSNLFKNQKKLPCNIRGDSGEAQGVINLNTNGNVVVTPYNSNFVWKIATASGVVFLT